MEVRWRLFARDVLSLLADDAGEFRFGIPPRPVRGLRLLGVVVRREGGGISAVTDSRQAEEARDKGVLGSGKKRDRGASSGDNSSGDGGLVEGEFGLLGIGEFVTYVLLLYTCRISCALGQEDLLLAVLNTAFRTAQTQALIGQRISRTPLRPFPTYSREVATGGETTATNSKPFSKI